MIEYGVIFLPFEKGGLEGDFIKLVRCWIKILILKFKYHLLSSLLKRGNSITSDGYGIYDAPYTFTEEGYITYREGSQTIYTKVIGETDDYLKIVPGTSVHYLNNFSEASASERDKKNIEYMYFDLQKPLDFIELKNN